MDSAYATFYHIFFQTPQFRAIFQISCKYHIPQEGEFHTHLEIYSYPTCNLRSKCTAARLLGRKHHHYVILLHIWTTDPSSRTVKQEKSSSIFITGSLYFRWCFAYQWDQKGVVHVSSELSRLCDTFTSQTWLLHDLPHIIISVSELMCYCG